MGGIGKWGIVLIVVTCATYMVSNVPAVLADPIIVALAQLRANTAIATPPLVTLQDPEVSGTTAVTSGKKVK